MTRQAYAAIALALMLATPALADMVIRDAYARAAMPGAPTGAVFMELENTSSDDDRLIAAASKAAARVELHTHIDDGNGILRMRHIEDGIALPAGATHSLARGGDHVMLMGLTGPLVQGEVISLTLTFEGAGERVIDVPVDLER